MAAFNFPNSPSTNDIHNENGVSFKWNGTVWKKIGTVANQLTQLGVTGISTFSNDVSIADKIIHTGDTNTAIRFPSADTITAETGGSERLRIDNNGNLTLGDPTYGANLGQLRVVNNAASTAASLALFGYGNTTTNTSFAKIQFASQENNVGGQITAEIGALAQGSAERGANLIFKTRPDTSGSSALERLRITSVGDVGIGEESPGNRLVVREDIAAASGAAILEINNLYQGTSGQSNASTSKIDFMFKNHNASHNWWGGRIACFNTDNYNQYTYLRFDTASQGNAAEKMRLTHHGRLGINETAPEELLHITHASAPGIQLEATSGGPYKSLIKMGGNDMEIRGSSGQMEFYTGNADGDSSTERVRIGASGEVSLRRGGISATPSLEIYGSGLASDAAADNLRIHNWGDSDGDYWQFGSNCGLDANGNNAKPSTTLKGAAICVDGRGGRVFIKTSPSSSSTVHEAFIMNQNGYIQTPKRPYFKANLANGTRITSGGYVTFGSVVHNNGSHYNASDGKFTAPIAGLYWFSARINAYDRIDYKIMVNGNEVEKGQYNTDNDEVGWWSNQLATIVYMTANQYAQVYVNHLDQNTDPYTWCTFMGYLIG